MIILHVCWGVVYFDGWEMLHRDGLTNLTKGTLHGYFNVLLVIASHMAISLLVSGWVGGGINSPRQQKKNFVGFRAHLCSIVHIHVVTVEPVYNRGQGFGSYREVSL